MARDWKGSSESLFKIIGASNHCDHEREANDFYATDPEAVRLLLGIETFDNRILEPACGTGHISKVLLDAGYNVESSDLVDRGFGRVADFLERTEPFDGDIVTNPPYKFAQEFVSKALEIVTEGHKVAMFLKLTFLEGKARRAMFDVTPPCVVWVSSSRLRCAMNGDFESVIGSNAVAYAWFIWEKGFKGETIIKWFN